MKVLVTGAIGFIGFHLTNKLIQNKIDVFGIDNINGYYNVKQKYDKLPFLGIDEETICRIRSFQAVFSQILSFLK